MTRVLHVITGMEVGGAENALFRLISSGDLKEHHVVVSLTGGGAMCGRFREAGIEPILLNFKKSFISDFLRLIRIIRKHQPDLVQTWMYHSDLIGGLAARFAGQRSVIWGVRHTGFAKGSSRATVLVMRLCALLSFWIPTYIVCAAEASRAAHVRYGYNKKKMVVIPNGLDLPVIDIYAERRNEFRRGLGLTENDVVIGIVGRFHPDKDHATFVQAAELLMVNHKNLKFLMVGRGLEEDNVELKRMLSDSSAQNFVFLGERDDVPACLNSMDIFCLSSRFEGFPNVVAEAMAMGLPCVVTDAGDAGFLIGEFGTVVPVAEPAELAAGIAEFVRRGQKHRQHIGGAARERVRAEFSIEKMRARFQGVYSRLTSSI